MLWQNELRHPASISCLERHSCPAGRCPNNSFLFLPQAAVVVVAAEELFLNLQLWKICGFSRVAFSREGAFREAASAAVGLRPNRSISACQLATSKRFVVIFSITRNWTLSTTAFQRKINRKSRKKAEKKGRQRGSAFPLGGTDAINRNCQYKNFISAKYAQSKAEAILNRLFPHRGWSRGAGLMPFARRIAAGVAPLGQRVRGVFRLPPLSLWTPLSPGRVVAPSVCYGP